MNESELVRKTNSIEYLFDQFDNERPKSSDKHVLSLTVK